MPYADSEQKKRRDREYYRENVERITERERQHYAENRDAILSGRASRNTPEKKPPTLRESGRGTQRTVEGIGKVGDRTVTFSPAMILALLQGRKTQTRRLATSPLRRVAIGDRLVVREHWKTLAMHDDLSPTKLGEKYRASIYPEKERAAPILYLADDARRGRWPDEDIAGWKPGKFRQAMHMPRWASRLALHITGSRIEPLQAITTADAAAEGITLRHSGSCPRVAYATLWDLLRPTEGSRWQDNPDVLVLTFRVERTPVPE